ncbi:hypothetical protein [Phytohabitans houttuyneae]|nr:hypothetical protein [Phytohabitans houttuyneae]
MIVAAVLAAAVLHASWNAVVKGVSDRAGLFVRTSVVGAAACAAALWFVPWPAGGSWPWLLASVAVHVLYNLGLLAAYRLGRSTRRTRWPAASARSWWRWSPCWRSASPSLRRGRPAWC